MDRWMEGEVRVNRILGYRKDSEKGCLGCSGWDQWGGKERVRTQEHPMGDETLARQVL